MNKPKTSNAFVAKTNLGVGNKRERLVRAKQARDANKRLVSMDKKLEKMAPKVVAVMTLDGGDYDASDLRDFLGEVCEQLRKEEGDGERGVYGGGEVV